MRNALLKHISRLKLKNFIESTDYLSDLKEDKKIPITQWTSDEVYHFFLDLSQESLAENLKDAASNGLQLISIFQVRKKFSHVFENSMKSFPLWEKKSTGSSTLKKFRFSFLDFRFPICQGI